MIIRLRRASSPEEARGAWRALVDALEELGVPTGGDYFVGTAEDLPEEAHARHTDPETSKRAAVRPPRNLRAIAAQILVSLERGTPMDSYELADDQHRHEGTVRPRIAPLKRHGLLHVVGEHHREGGGDCELLALTDEGRLYLASLRNGRGTA